LKLQKRNSQRVNVYLDGVFAFGLARITAAWLQIGQELGDEKIAELLAADGSEVAFQKALRFLENRPRAEAEVRRRLHEHQISDEVIDPVIERLRRGGLIDDARFAKEWVENRSTFRPRGRRALAQEMRQHGLPGEMIQEAISDVDEEALALQAARKQTRKLHDLEWLDFRRKLSGFLARRGFSYATIAPVVTQTWNELNKPETSSDDFEDYEVNS
jgi:regulatory protein